MPFAWMHLKPITEALAGREHVLGLGLAGAAAVVLLVVLLTRLPHWLRAKRHPTLTPFQLEEMLQGPHPLIVDLREPEAFRKQGHIRGALHIPFPQLPARVKEVLADARHPVPRAIVLVDEHDPQAHRAADLLKAHGADWLYVLMDGFHGWRKANFPTVR
ncbi:MAG TPA: rhodanese-like domain-containing protein [Holophagaceae bacterium]|nr:rhodanese-like domain-containing protein [Holophagaceae bacterium]